jgi:hypothetical protein
VYFDFEATISYFVKNTKQISKGANIPMTTKKACSEHPPWPLTTNAIASQKCVVCGEFDEPFAVHLYWLSRRGGKDSKNLMCGNIRCFSTARRSRRQRKKMEREGETRYFFSSFLKPFVNVFPATNVVGGITCAPLPLDTKASVCARKIRHNQTCTDTIKYLQTFPDNYKLSPPRWLRPTQFFKKRKKVLSFFFPLQSQTEKSLFPAETHLYLRHIKQNIASTSAGAYYFCYFFSDV